MSRIDEEFFNEAMGKLEGASPGIGRRLREMMPKYYKLDPKTHEVTPFPEDLSVLEWAEGFAHQERRVKETMVGFIWVSTVFLSMDHSWKGGKPVLFETMLFNGPEEIDQIMRRYSTWNEAVQGHDVIVANLRQLPMMREFMALPRKRRIRLARVRRMNQKRHQDRQLKEVFERMEETRRTGEDHEVTSE